MPSGHPTRGVLRPLSDHALDLLRRLEREPVPRSSINPGVRDRLGREGLIRFEDLSRGFHGRLVTHAVITDAGRAKLRPSAQPLPDTATLHGGDEAP